MQNFLRIVMQHMARHMPEGDSSELQMRRMTLGYRIFNVNDNPS